MQVIGKGNSSRWILDAFDRAALEHAFRLDPFPNASARQQLGLELNVSPRQIQVWFQNRRQREKLQNAGRLPNTQRVDSPPEEVSFTGMKQKRDILHMLKDMRPATMQMQMQQQLTNAQAQLLTQATTFRVLSADPQQPVGCVQPIMMAASPQTSPPASPPADQQLELAPEPAREARGRHGGRAMAPPFGPVGQARRRPDDAIHSRHLLLTLTGIVVNLAFRGFSDSCSPSPRAAFGLSPFACWRARGKGGSPMVGLAMGRSYSHGEISHNHREVILISGVV